MNYRDFSAFNFKHDYFTNTDRVFFVIGQKQKIAALKRRFHAAATKKETKIKLSADVTKVNSEKSPNL